jgi:deazaflavin-dependent oxidoreductase (nitroreductase family)
MQNKISNQQLTRMFRQLNKFMLFMWRLDLSWMLNVWPECSGQILVLTHTGRKTGLKRKTPVNFAVVDGELYCTAGFGKGSDWYLNLKANPAVEVWLPDRSWFEGTVEDVSNSPRRTELMRAVLIGSGLAAYVFGINPNKLSDLELEQLSTDYRLLHISRGQARTGKGGPGDLAWVWPVAVFLMIPFLSRRRGPAENRGTLRGRCCK